MSVDGQQFGQRQRFFDLEWGMFTDLGLLDGTTPVVPACPLVQDKLAPAETDILVDWIATPSSLHRVERRAKRPFGV